ncbi:MAG: zinc ribbon domain-containing protein [Syntrophales bacterium]|nr:zinc ribbon domain-containing protein [Syntrophales bacterium]
MFCFKCGEKISDDSNFCFSCGLKIENSQNSIEPKTRGISNIESSELDIPDSIPALSPHDLINLKQRRKWGWGWIVMLASYTSYYSRNAVKIDNYLIKTFIELGGFVLLLPCYFWIRSYIARYTDDLYKPSIIAGIASLFIVGSLHVIAEVFFRG